MEYSLTVYLIYMALINGATFLAFFADKQAARGGRRRTRETRLLGMLLLGGVVGGWFGIYRVRHKSQHLSFHLIFGLASVLHITLIVWALAGFPELL
jgi:uncharacterized membrane protein YsdA (DUF1294 family)